MGRMGRERTSTTSPGDAASIAALLPLCAVLEELYLQCNEITDEGAIAVADQIERGATPRLRELHILWGNDIGDRGRTALQHACQSNSVRLA